MLAKWTLEKRLQTTDPVSDNEDSIGPGKGQLAENLCLSVRDAATMVPDWENMELDASGLIPDCVPEWQLDRG